MADTQSCAQPKNIALRLCYDGTDFHGWQIQKSDRTVAQTVQDALARAVGHPVTLRGCGRTDAGVHALHYVASARLVASIPTERLPFALRAFLPGDISVLGTATVPDEFEPILFCRKKQYSYRVYNAAHPDPFLRHRACFYPHRLDRGAMEIACRHFEGTHDFAAFRSQGTEVASTVRTVRAVRMEARGAHLFFHVAADGFLYNMARAIMGTLLYIGIGKLRPEDVPRLLEGKNRSASGPTAPPQGLYMTGVWYDEGLLPWAPESYEGLGACSAAKPEDDPSSPVVGTAWAKGQKEGTP